MNHSLLCYTLFLARWILKTEKMNLELFQAVAKNDKHSFLKVIRHDELSIHQKTGKSLNTVLHLACRFGHGGLVTEIIKLVPELTATTNIRDETPLHEACRRGNSTIVVALMEVNPWVASMINFEKQSAFFLACRFGHLDVVRIMMNQQWLMDFEENEFDSSPLHAAVSKGHTEIVRAILEKCPNFAWKIDQNRSSPLHIACSEGNLEITRMLLKVSPEMAAQMNEHGFTPPQLATVSGMVKIVEELVSESPSSLLGVTKEGETMCHLAVRFRRYEIFASLATAFHGTSLLCQPNHGGNTVLHLAVFAGCSKITSYIVRKTTVEINRKNNRGETALDLLKGTGRTSEVLKIKRIIGKYGGKRSSELLSFPPNVQQTNPIAASFDCPAQVQEPDLILPPCSDAMVEIVVANAASMRDCAGGDGEIEVQSKSNGLAATEDREAEKPDPSLNDDQPESESSETIETSRSDLRRHKRLSERHRKELSDIFRNRHYREHDIHREGLQNARNTITVVAILIASVAFTAGMNPPGGVYQDGALKGQSTVVKKTAFKVFVVSNTSALFASICIVIVLVSIIPFRRKPLMKLLVIAHKIMWLAVAFMATAYIAATRVIIPSDQGTKWTLELLLFICAGSLGVVFVFLGAAFAGHMMRKFKWRKEEGRKLKNAKNGKLRSSLSINSDVSSGIRLGYYAY